LGEKKKALKRKGNDFRRGGVKEKKCSCRKRGKTSTFRRGKSLIGLTHLQLLLYY